MPVGMTQDLLEQVADAEVMAMTLVVVDVPAGERGLIQMPDEGLVLQVQLLEAVGVELHDRRIVDLLEQVGPRRRSYGAAGRG